MTETAVNSQPSVMGYFAYWIRPLRLADELPSALANRLVRAAIHAAPPACRPPPVEAWLFDAATDHGDGIDCAHVVGWLRLRRVLGDDAGVLDPETARYGYGPLGAPPRSRHPRWVRTVPGGRPRRRTSGLRPESAPRRRLLRSSRLDAR
ncbi:MAG: hypothetical protein MZV65_33305 [Chromatiales bacterium]|nr:hypothetical protein [Chromatiales bacterium]